MLLSSSVSATGSARLDAQSFVITRTLSPAAEQSRLALPSVDPLRLSRRAAHHSILGAALTAINALLTPRRIRLDAPSNSRILGADRDGRVADHFCPWSIAIVSGASAQVSPRCCSS